MLASLTLRIALIKFRIIDKASVNRAQRIEGYGGWHIHSPIHKEYWDELEQTFPVVETRESVTSDGDMRGGLVKTYPVSEIGDFSHVWNRLLSEIYSNEYNEIVARATSVPLDQSKKVLRLLCYTSGGFIDKHFDNQYGKLLTQIFYVNKTWSQSWGGALELFDFRYNTQDILAHSVPPIIDQSIINLTSANASHRVAPLNCPAAVHRRALIVEWYDSAGRCN